MSWSAEFRAALASREPLRLIYLIEPVVMPDGPQSTFAVSSHAVPGRDTTISIARDGEGRPSVSVVGQEVDTNTWRSVLGAFSFDLTEPIGRIFAYWTPGTILRLRAGLPGWDYSQYQTLALGQYRQVVRKGMAPVWSAECWDMFAAMETRISLTAAQTDLFYGVTATATITSDYTAADGSITVDSTTGFQRETGGLWLIAITGNSGAVFYATATGSTATSFTGLTVNLFGTGDEDANAGNTIAEVAYLSGHPVDILRRMVTSTGGGTNGTYDTYPKSWGWGIPKELLSDDLVTVRDKVLVSTHSWPLFATESTTNGWSWLQAHLAAGACWPVVRQGQISMRAAQDLTDPRYHSGFVIGADDVVELLEHEVPDGSHPMEYSQMRVPHFVGIEVSTIEAPTSLPLLAVYWHNGTQGAPTVYWTSTHASNLISRAAYYYTRRPERLSLRLGGLRAAELVAGDVVGLDVPWLTTVRRDRDGQRQDPAAVMVQQVSPSYSHHFVDVSLIIVPEYAGE